MSKQAALAHVDTISDSSETVNDVDAPRAQRKGAAFWLAFLAILVPLFLSALDISAVPTALPTITEDLKGGDNFVWVGSSYGLASTAIMLLCGRLADIFGRKLLMLISIVLFALGSALAGAAKSMDMLIAARVIQGVGGGAIYTMAQIITSDLVSLAERGLYQGLLVLSYSLAAGTGPVIGGALADGASWRWIFYLNLPLTGTAFVLVAIFLHVRAPEGSIAQKLSRMDWFGNILMAAGSTLTLIGLTWGGVHYPWNSVHVIAPLVIGPILMAMFFIYETMFAAEPTLPLDVLSNRTTLSAYLATFCHGVTSIAVIYYLPAFFQACKGASPIRSSVDTLPVALVLSPFAFICGVIVKITGTYRPVNLIGWILSIIGFGVLTLLRPGSSTGESVGFPFLMAAGAGIIYTATVFPVLAPLPVARNAAALAFFAFCRTFAQTWGIAIAGVILQNQLKTRLPVAFTSQFPEGVEIAYAAVPIIRHLDEPLRSEVRDAFAGSLATVWKTMIGICGLGFLSVFLLEEVPLVKHTDETYGLKDTPRGGNSIDTEMEAGTQK